MKKTSKQKSAVKPRLNAESIRLLGGRAMTQVGGGMRRACTGCDSCEMGTSSQQTQDR